MEASATPQPHNAEIEVIDRYGARWRYKRAEGYSWAFGLVAGTNDEDDLNMVEVWHEDADGDTECIAHFPYAAMAGYVTENTAHNLNLREIEPEWAREKAAGRARLIAAIPTSWLDPLMTGPTAVIGPPPYGCDDIETLLTAIRCRLEEISA